MLINFLVQKLQSTKTLILDLFCPQKYLKNNAKAEYFTEIDEIFITAHVLKCGIGIPTL